MADAPALNRGVGTPTKCRSCKAPVVFAVMYTSGKSSPFEIDDAGEWVLENGIAKHVGPVSKPLELGAAPGPQRYTSHFARCPQAKQWRAPR